MRNTLLTFALASLSGVMSAAPSHSHASAPHASTHRVRKGETAASIARSNGLSLAQLSSLNPRVKLSRLQVGNTLHLGKTHRASADRTEAKALDTIGASGAHSSVLALPPTPRLRETGLIHLERMLPTPIGPELGPVSQVSEAPAPDSPDHLASKLQPILPVLAVEATLPSQIEFVAADREHLDLLWPVETRSISSAWGPRMRSHVVRVRNHRKRRVRYHGRHKGIDLNAPMGTSVYAAMDGRVIYVGKKKGYGNCITVDHGNGVLTHYAHHQANLVEEGDVVRRGQKIAEVGRTGNATGPHLHFELRIDGSQRNPLPFLDDEEEISSDVMAMNAKIGGSRR